MPSIPVAGHSHQSPHCCQRRLLAPSNKHFQTKGRGFQQPLAPHQHWYLYILYINFKNTFVYLVALIDGFSRFIFHYELKLSVEALDVEIMLERARAKFPGVNPILITDNRPQFIAKELKAYLQLVGITHRKTRFYYPQSNGKIERFYQTCKNEAIRKSSFIDFDDLEQQLATYIEFYSYQRLHSSLGYITTWDMLQGNQARIITKRKEKLSAATQKRIEQRKKQKPPQSARLD